jgi:hypothetical protein
MSILHLIVRRHMKTRAPDRRAQRGCTAPPLLQEAIAGIALVPGIGIDAARTGEPQRRGSAASVREQESEPSSVPSNGEGRVRR